MSIVVIHICITIVVLACVLIVVVIVMSLAVCVATVLVLVTKHVLTSTYCELSHVQHELMLLLGSAMWKVIPDGHR
jgi:hypothetical protein